MKLYQEGQSIKAVCHTCKDMVSATFKYRDVPFSDGNGMAEDILVAVCNECDHVVAIPAQSTPAIKEARKRAINSVEALLPAIFVDVLELASYKIDENYGSEFKKKLLWFFIHEYATGEKNTSKLIQMHSEIENKFPSGRGLKKKRLSFKVSDTMDSDLKTLSAETHLSQTDVLKSVVFAISESILEKPNPSLMKKLKSIASISG